MARSHHLFRCLNIRDPVAHKDLIEKNSIIGFDGAVVHAPDGEPVEWITADPREMPVEKPLLVRMVRLNETSVRAMNKLEVADREGDGQRRADRD